MLKRIRLWLALVAFLIPVGLVATVHAQAVQSYNATSPLQPGVIVRLASGSSDTVEALSQTDAKNMFGVVINPNATTLTLSTPSSKQVFVTTSGTYSVLVSSQNGAIKVGDYVAVSSLDGIGMKASGGDPEILGKAVSSFSGSSDSLGTAQLKGSRSNTTVQLGQISVNIAIGRNPLQVQQTKNSLPSFLRSAGQSISNKPVSTQRAYLSLAIIFISALIAGSMLYAGVRSSVISIGRNPLSKKSITRSLVQVVLTSLIVLIIGLFAVYLLLRF